MIKRSVSFLIIFYCLSSAAFAKDISFELTADRDRVAVGQPAVVYLTFNGTQDIPAVELKTGDGFQARYVGPSTRMSIVNGKVSSSITHIYSLLAVKTGTFTIGPVTFTYKDDTYTSNALSVEVLAGDVPQQQQSSEQPSLQAHDLKDRIFLVMDVPRVTAYINENIPVKLKLYVTRLGVRDIQFPEFSHEGFSVKGFDQPKQYQETLKDIQYDVIEFDTMVFGTRSGALQLGPASLKCNLILKKESSRGRQMGSDDFFSNDIFNDFFGRYQAYPLTIAAAEVPLTVLELPQANKPADYKGAIGTFDMDVSISPSEVTVGDPITIRAVIRGEGNSDTVTMPSCNAGANFKVYEPQVKQENGVKTFEEIVMPLSSDVVEIPALRFSYFDPAGGQYETKTKGPFPIRVTKPVKPEEQKIVEAVSKPALPRDEKLGRDIVYIKDSMGELKPLPQKSVSAGMLLSGILIPPLGLLFAIVFRYYRLRLKTDTRYARKRNAPRKASIGIKKARQALHAGNKNEFFDAVFSTAQEYWGDHFHLSSQGITLSVVEETLHGKNVPAEILADARDIFQVCDMARYASAELSQADMNGTLKKLETVIAYFQKNAV
ncbi:MAG TPA: BatD family protein [Candidatus Omnitrophota bacterium]|nr:BatD family protein [Candidatus Omnitrophota bacterium]HPT06602.1 BatD family protein [Candidatus Omnitrophota bacterium]